MKNYLLPVILSVSLLIALPSGAAESNLTALQQAASACEGSVGGYDLKVDTEHSSLKAGGGVCNYSVTSKDDQAVSGLAITIEYGCTKELQEAWKGKTRQRPQYTTENGNGEVSRSSTALLLREDRAGRGFTGDFTVQEKMFLLQLPSISITIVVNTSVKQPKKSSDEPNPAVLDFDAPKAQSLAQSLGAKFLGESMASLECAGPVPCPAVEPARGAVIKLYSTPKDQESYRLEDVFSLAGGKKVAEPFDQLDGTLDQKYGNGTVKFAVGWQDRNKVRQTRCFEQPVSDVWNLTDARINAALQNGDWTFRRVVATEFAVPVDIRYRVLDELEAMVRDPKNAQQQVDEGRGEKLLFGSELDFDTQIFLFDSSNKQVAKSDPARNVKLTYKVRYPVVFVPGTAGSRLSTGGSEIWPQWVTSGNYGNTTSWASMRLDDNQGGPPVEVDDVFRYYAVCTKVFPFIDFITSKGCVYLGWIDHMKAAGYEEGKTMLFFPYDWRADILKHPLNMDKIVDRALALNYNRKAASAAPSYVRAPDEKVVVVTHSQGGLVARAYTADQKRADKVAYMIQLAPTNYGSLKALKAAGMTGYSFETPFLDPQVGKWMARNYPAAYYQFPVSPNGSGEIDQVLFDEKGDPVPNTRAELSKLKTFMFCDRKPTTIPTIEPCAESTMNTQILDDAVAFHKLTNLPSPVTMGVPTFVVAGTDQQTIVGYRYLKNQVKVSKANLESVLGTAMPTDVKTISVDALKKLGKLSAETIYQATYDIVGSQATFGRAEDLDYLVALPSYAEVYRPCGDNLVPWHRATALPGVKPLYVKGVSHGGMTEDSTVQSHVDRILDGVSPVGLPQPTLCSSDPTGAMKGVVVTAESSPANLHVYDDQGRHVGLKPDGTQEIGIPGAIFEDRGTTQVVILPPTDKPLRVVMAGLIDTTDFNVRITSSSGGTEKHVDYLSVPEAKNSTAEIKFTSANLGEATELKVDMENDGKVDQTLKPSSVTTFSSNESAGSSSTGTAKGVGDVGVVAMVGLALVGLAALVVGWLLLRRRGSKTVRQ